MSRARAMRLAAALLLPGALLFFAAAANAAPVEPPALAGIPIDFILFAATLVGIALFHHHTLPIAVGGLAIISLWKIGFSPFTEGPAVGGWKPVMDKFFDPQKGVVAAIEQKLGVSTGG